MTTLRNALRSLCSLPSLRVLGVALVASAMLIAPVSAQVAVKAKTLHTMNGAPITDGVVVIGADGKISAVGPASRVRIPSGATVHETEVATPGLVDVRSTLGLSGAYNSNVGPVRDQDQLETSSPIQPELRAIDAYNAREELIAYARGFGVTTVHTGHGPGALISGRTMVVKTRGDSVEEALIEPAKMVAVTLGRLDSDFRSPGTRAKSVAMLRGALMDAQQYLDKQKKAAEKAEESEGDEDSKGGSGPPRDLRKETLAKVLEGEITMMVQANSAVDIAGALRLQKEFGFDMVIDGGAEAYLLLDEIKEAGVPVFVHAARARIQNKTLEIAKILEDAGIPFAVQTGHEGYVPKTRVLIFEVAHYAAHGLSAQDALAAVTIDSAKLLGLDGRLGSLEVGKDGDVAMFTGDPFEYLTQVCGVLIEGELVSDTCR